MSAASPLRLRQLVPNRRGGLSAVLAKANVTPTGGAVLLFVVAGWFLARVVAAKTMYLIVYACLLGIVVSWFLARRRLAIDVERSDLPPRTREGQTLAVQLQLAARRRAATIVVTEQLPSSLGAPVDIPLAVLSRGQTHEHRYTMTPRRRGVFDVGPLVATWSDPFGLTTHTQVLAEPVELIVHPTVEPVHDRVLTRMWEDPPVRPPVSKPWPVGFEFYGMRDYVPGDDLRRVVWAQVAKTGKMLVRESEQGITDRVVVLLDTHREMHSPGDPSETLESAVRVAASLGVRHLDDGFSVSLLTNDGAALTEARGANARLPYLDALARVALSGTPIDDAATRLVSLARTKAHVIVVTPHLEAKTATQLRLLVERGAGVVVANVQWEQSDPVALSRAASIGAQVVQIPAGVSLEAAFMNFAGAGGRR